MHEVTYDYLKPTEVQLKKMEDLRAAAKIYGDLLELMLPEGPDKDYIIRNHRTTAMWVNVCLTRYHDGTPRA